MKHGLTIFLQAVVVLIAVASLALLIRFPLTEGRATNLDLFHIYADPLIIYGYLASIAFFVALFQTFKLLGYIGKKQIFSHNSLKSLKKIKYCAILLSILIVIAAIYIRVTFNGNADDDPAGFVGLSIVSAFFFVVIATTSAVFERALKSAIDIKDENDLTV